MGILFPPKKTTDRKTKKRRRRRASLPRLLGCCVTWKWFYSVMAPRRCHARGCICTLRHFPFHFFAPFLPIVFLFHPFRHPRHCRIPVHLFFFLCASPIARVPCGSPCIGSFLVRPFLRRPPPPPVVFFWRRSLQGFKPPSGWMCPTRRCSSWDFIIHRQTTRSVVSPQRDEEKHYKTTRRRFFLPPVTPKPHASPPLHGFLPPRRCSRARRPWHHRAEGRHRMHRDGRGTTPAVTCLWKGIPIHRLSSRLPCPILLALPKRIGIPPSTTRQGKRRRHEKKKKKKKMKKKKRNHIQPRIPLLLPPPPPPHRTFYMCKRRSMYEPKWLCHGVKRLPPILFKCGWMCASRLLRRNSNPWNAVQDFI